MTIELDHSYLCYKRRFLIALAVAILLGLAVVFLVVYHHYTIYGERHIASEQRKQAENNHKLYLTEVMARKQAEALAITAKTKIESTERSTDQRTSR